MQKLRFNARSSFDEFCSDESVNFPKAIQLEFAAKGWFVDEVESWLKNRDKGVTKKEASDGKKNRPEMQAANQYREKPDFKPASVKTPVIAANFNPGVCWGYPTISRLTYENFVGEESTYTKSAGQPLWIDPLLAGRG